MKKLLAVKKQLFMFLVTMLTSYSAVSGIQPPPVPIPEPSMLPLFALAAIVFYIVKKKK
ncbi:PEP-CTERM sorting domain-containing protein [Thalassotalea agariperforans]